MKFVRKIFTVIALVIMLSGCCLFMTGCFEENIDGILLSNVSYNSIKTTAGSDEIDFKFNCKVKNSTSNALTFEVVYKVRTTILGSDHVKKETVILQPKESKKLTYTRHIDDRAYLKSITVENVTLYTPA